MNLIVLSGILFTVGLVGLIIIILGLIARMPNYRYKQHDEPQPGRKVYEGDPGWGYKEGFEITHHKVIGAKSTACGADYQTIIITDDLLRVTCKRCKDYIRKHGVRR